jgi:acetate kinase
MATTGTTLAVNAGSSSVKGALFTFDAAPRALARVAIDITGEEAAERLHAWVREHAGGAPLSAIGHRIVHGGPVHRDPQPITPAFVDELRQLIAFAPNHLPDEIALVQQFAAREPNVPQVACFDTGFHQTMPEVAQRLAIPAVYHARGVRRYGFHGLSYAYVIEELRRLAGGDAANGRVVAAHLGNGASVAAFRNGRSIDTTMAFTPIGGIVMSTRSGDLDPGVITYLGRTERLSPDELEALLSQRSGLLGISETSSNMKALLEHEATDERCRLAIEMFVYSAAKAIGGFVAALRGLDTLVFSGGTGEHAAPVRARICAAFTYLDLGLDDARNETNADVISSPQSRVVVRVIPTNEELMIARAVGRVLAPE